MTERSANDITTPARLVLDAYIIDPVTKLPMAPGVASGGATAAKQDEQTDALGDILTELEDTTPAATREAPYTDVVTMVEDAPLSPAAEGVLVNCTVAGTVTFANVGGDSFTLNFAVGLSRLEGIEIAQFTATGSGFTGAIYGLRR